MHITTCHMCFQSQLKKLIRSLTLMDTGDIFDLAIFWMEHEDLRGPVWADALCSPSRGREFIPTRCFPAAFFGHSSFDKGNYDSQKLIPTKSKLLVDSKLALFLQINMTTLWNYILNSVLVSFPSVGFHARVATTFHNLELYNFAFHAPTNMSRSEKRGCRWRSKMLSIGSFFSSFWAVSNWLISFKINKWCLVFYLVLLSMQQEVYANYLQCVLSLANFFPSSTAYFKKCSK